MDLQADRGPCHGNDPLTSAEDHMVQPLDENGNGLVCVREQGGNGRFKGPHPNATGWQPYYDDRV